MGGFAKWPDSHPGNCIWHECKAIHVLLLSRPGKCMFLEIVYDRKYCHSCNITVNSTFCKRLCLKAGEMVQWINTPAARPGDLGSIPRANMVERENQPIHCLLTSACVPINLLMSTHKIKTIKIFKTDLRYA